MDYYLVKKMGLQILQTPDREIRCYEICQRGEKLTGPRLFSPKQQPATKATIVGYQSNSQLLKAINLSFASLCTLASHTFIYLHPPSTSVAPVSNNALNFVFLSWNTFRRQRRQYEKPQDVETLVVQLSGGIIQYSIIGLTRQAQKTHN